MKPSDWSILSLLFVSSLFILGTIIALYVTLFLPKDLAAFLAKDQLPMFFQDLQARDIPIEHLIDHCKSEDVMSYGIDLCKGEGDDPISWMSTSIIHDVQDKLSIVTQYSIYLYGFAVVMLILFAAGLFLCFDLLRVRKRPLYLLAGYYVLPVLLFIASAFVSVHPLVDAFIVDKLRLIAFVLAITGLIPVGLWKYLSYI